MIYLAKILPVVLLPVGLTIVLLVASLLLRKRWLAFAALAVLWVSSTPLAADWAMRAAEGWQTPVSVGSVRGADAIVVLTGMLQTVPGAPGTYEWGGGVDRFDAGVALLKAEKAPVLVFPGGWVPWRPDRRPEGEVLAERAIALGIPRERIVVAGRASNTEAEAAAVAAALGSPAAPGARREIILVSSAYHLRRARLNFEKAGFDVVPFPVDFQTGDGPISFIDVLPAADALKDTETALREFYGYLFYRIVG